MTAKSKSRKDKAERFGEIRCQNCLSRFRPPHEAEKAACPECGLEWYISWIDDLAKIRKPVWESWEQSNAGRQQTEE